MFDCSYIEKFATALGPHLRLTIFRKTSAQNDTPDCENKMYSHSFSRAYFSVDFPKEHFILFCSRITLERVRSDDSALYATTRIWWTLKSKPNHISYGIYNNTLHTTRRDRLTAISHWLIQRCNDLTKQQRGIPKFRKFKSKQTNSDLLSLHVGLHFQVFTKCFS